MTVTIKPTLRSSPFRGRDIIGLLLAAVMLSACQQQPPAKSSSGDNTEKTDAAEASLPISEPARVACLADPVGNTPLDADIRKHQKQINAYTEPTQYWLQLGRDWVRKARIASDPGFYINVDACVEMALKIEPDRSEALGLHGLALMNGHKFSEAKAVATRILQKDPRNLVALGILSDAQLELGEFEAAANTAQMLMDSRPDMASYARASYLRWLQGDVKTAKILIRQALLAGRDVNDPEPAAWTFVEAGMIFWQEGDYEGADAVFEEALRWVPDYPAAWVGRGRAALSMGEPEKAITYLENAYRRYPLPETAWLLGDARLMSGDSNGAEREYQRVILEGKRMDRLTLALFYATKNRSIEDALHLLEAEREIRHSIYVDDTDSWILYRLGRYPEAKQASDRALRLGTRDARLLYHAGAIRCAMGKCASGRKKIREALKLNPKFDSTASAEAKQILSGNEAYVLLKQ
jgi:tetratricopeptide (TPR) repeat protein